MAVEITVDERDVQINADGKFVLRAHQEQVYDAENVQSMIQDWTKKSADLQTWLDNYEQHLADGRKLLEQQLGLQKDRVEKELESLREGLALWSDARRQDQ
jgi:hypothetical protein